MTEFFDFGRDQPWLAFFLICASYYLLKFVITTPMRMLNRWCRHKNIAAKGWPPPHLDADGDWKPESENA